METKLFHHKEHQQIALHRIGSGSKYVWAFHGFAQDGTAFRKPFQKLLSEYTVLAPDLPLHGQTVLQRPRWGKEDFLHLFELLSEETPSNVQPICIAHSFGARCVVASLPELPHSIAQLILLQPDGFSTHQAQWLQGVPPRLQALLGKLLLHRKPLLPLARRLRRLGLLDAHSLRFLETQLKDAATRRRLLGTWRAIPHFKVNPDAFLQELAHRQLKALLVTGQHDALICSKSIREMLENDPLVACLELPIAHSLVSIDMGQVLFEL